MKNIKKIDMALLYVEDDAITRLDVFKKLQRAISMVYQARDGGEGLELFKAHRPEVVVTDIVMPVMNGLELAREIRNLSPRTRIIVTSVHNDPAFFLEAIDIGIDQYIMKPLSEIRLFDAIRKSQEILSLDRTLAFRNREQKILIRDLREAHDKIKALSGIIPICSYCKNIRNDKGYWNQLEQFFAEHSGAEFSHGICPDCIKKHFPSYCA